MMPSCWFPCRPVMKFLKFGDSEVFGESSAHHLSRLQFCTGQFQNRPPASPPGQTPGHLTFLKNFGQIPRYIASLDGQMPHPLELQRGANPPPSRHAKATVETSSAQFDL